MAETRAPAASPYQPLNPSLRQIRLLHVDPDPTNLSAVLKIVSLNDKPSYTALSYTWGLEMSTGAGIALNGCPRQPVTLNLQIALEHLCADADKPFKLWIDALCINQSDLVEKSHQIRLMTDVYGIAESTCVWLGPAGDNSDLAMATIGELYADGNIFLSDDSLSEVQLEAINALQRRPWWSRIWVLQELMLSPNPTVRCGNAELPVEAFVHLEDMRRGYNRPEKRSQSHLLSRVCSLIQQNPFRHVLADYVDDKPRARAGGSFLGEWTLLVDDLEATNPRDKIYGLLGLATPEDVIFINPDYSKSVADVYTRAAVRLIIGEQSIFYLQFDNDHKNPKHALPSWCPDYSCEPDWPRRGYIPIRVGNGNLHDIFSASQSSFWSGTTLTASDIFPETGLGELHLRGVDFDIIEYVGPNPFMALYEGTVMAERLENIKARDEQTRQNVLVWEKEVIAKWEQDEWPYSTLNLSQAEVFWRTLMWDRDWHRRRLMHSHARYFLAWLGREDVDASHAAAEAIAGKDEAEARRTFVKPFTDCAVTRSHGRSFIITKTGFIGLAPFRTAVGDAITILQAGDVPFVLRQRANSSGDPDSDDTKQGRYEFVGEAYVHGIMDGQAVTRAREEDVKVFVLN